MGGLGGSLALGRRRDGLNLAVSGGFIPRFIPRFIARFIARLEVGTVAVGRGSVPRFGAGCLVAYDFLGKARLKAGSSGVCGQQRKQKKQKAQGSPPRQQARCYQKPGPIVPYQIPFPLWGKVARSAG